MRLSIARGSLACVVACVAVALGCDESSSAPFAPMATTVEQCEGPDEIPERPFLPAGFLAEASYYPCVRPQPGLEGAAFDEIPPPGATVTGVPLDISLPWTGEELAGHDVIFWYDASTGHDSKVAARLAMRGAGSTGYFVVPMSSDDNPLPIKLHPSPEATTGDYSLFFAIEDGTGTPTAPHIGPLGKTSAYVIKVGTGDIQINLHWRTLVDLDLYVTDPFEEEISYLNTTSESGGELDLDSYPACAFANDKGRGNENVFWAKNTAPIGSYVISVNMYSDCGTYEERIETDYRVTLVLNSSTVQSFTGKFSSERDDQTHVVAKFDY